MSLLQSGISNSRGSFEEAEGPPAHLAPEGPLAEGAAAEAPQQRHSQPLRRVMELLQLGGSAVRTRYVQLTSEFKQPDTLATAYFVAAFIFMSIAGFATLVVPEAVLYKVTENGIIHGCTPSGQPFPGLRSASGDPQQPPFPSGGTWPGLRLLPELVVPEDSFCTVVVPIRPLRLGPFDVTSTDGTVLLRVLPHAEAADPLGSEGFKSYKQLLTLTTKKGNPITYCNEAVHATQGRPAEFQLLAADSEVAASLAFGQAESQYVVSMPGSGSFCFWGSEDFSTINVSDSVGKRVAAAKMCKCKFDPSGDYCCVRVEPGNDAGLVICTLLCINHVGDHSL